MSKLTLADRELLGQCFDEYRRLDDEYSRHIRQGREIKKERDQLSSRSLAEKFHVCPEYITKLRREWSQGYPLK